MRGDILKEGGIFADQILQLLIAPRHISLRASQKFLICALLFARTKSIMARSGM